MPISLLNSKRCSTANLLLLGVPLLLPQAELATTLKRELKQSTQTTENSFRPLVQSWSDRFGTNAVSPLLTLARDASLPDDRRYIAVMAAAQLGGLAGAPQIHPLLEDRSWMVRSASLKALGALRHPASARPVMKSLKDRALVVRLQAVETLEQLNPPGVETALLDTLTYDPNFSANGKALWVPYRALEALERLGARASIGKLEKLTTSRWAKRDPKLQARLRQSITTLSKSAR